MNVLINGTTLNVNNAYTERDTVSGIITCTIVVPQSEMDYADLKALFKGNTGDIVCTKDDESTELFSGFAYSSILDDDANGQYIVKLTADEYTFQLGRNRQLEADKASLESTVTAKNSEISTLNGAISEKETVITKQEETITELQASIIIKDEEITAKDAEIAELLAIAEEYADMVFGSLMETEIELPEAEIEDLESEVM